MPGLRTQVAWQQDVLSERLQMLGKTKRRRAGGSPPFCFSFFCYTYCMTALALIFTLSAIGISETVYLIKKRKAMERPVCPIGEDCTVVLESKYNRIFFIHNDILGLIGYFFISTFSALIVIGAGPATMFGLILKALIAFASLMSLFFVFLQWKVIKAWCFWCLLSAITIWLMAIIVYVGSLIN
jgi:uncharacterized membrane protein